MNTQNYEPPNDKRTLSFIALFKVIKEKIITELKRSNRMLEDDYINQVCAEAAKDLLTGFDQIPTQEELNEHIKFLKNKLLIHN